MGRPKLLLPYRGTTIVGALVASLRAAQVDPVLVVASPQSALAAWAREEGIETAINPAPERGMLSSILSAIEHLGGAQELAASLQRRGAHLLVSPCDLPRLRAATVARLIAELAASDRRLAVPVYEGRRGHPLVLDAECLSDIPSLDLDVGLRQLLERRRTELLRVDVDDPGVLADVDTPADYAKLLEEENGPHTITPPRRRRSGDRSDSKERG